MLKSFPKKLLEDPSNDSTGKVFALSEFSCNYAFKYECKSYFQEEEDTEWIVKPYLESIPERLMKDFWEINVNTLVECSRKLSKEKQEALYIWCEKEYVSGHFSQILCDFRKEYIGFFNSLEEWAEEQLSKEIKLPLYLQECVDYKKLAYIFLQSDYHWYDGFVFKKHRES
ncbi:MAG: antirestriction protein ArdA [Clostridium sp.]|nr:antirestriction protein ArdA [Clostridium sp.]